MSRERFAARMNLTLTDERCNAKDTRLGDEGLCFPNSGRGCTVKVCTLLQFTGMHKPHNERSKTGTGTGPSTYPNSGHCPSYAPDLRSRPHDIGASHARIALSQQRSRRSLKCNHLITRRRALISSSPCRQPCSVAMLNTQRATRDRTTGPLLHLHHCLYV